MAYQPRRLMIPPGAVGCKRGLDGCQERLQQFRNFIRNTRSKNAKHQPCEADDFQVKSADGQFLHLAADTASLTLAGPLFVSNGLSERTQFLSDLVFFRIEVISQAIEVLFQHRHSLVEGSTRARAYNGARLTGYDGNTCGISLKSDRLRREKGRRKLVEPCGDFLQQGWSAKRSTNLTQTHGNGAEAKHLQHRPGVADACRLIGGQHEAHKGSDENTGHGHPCWPRVRHSDNQRTPPKCKRHYLSLLLAEVQPSNVLRFSRGGSSSHRPPSAANAC
jgi:hypothetical protein